jgi:hypothetical protein
MIQFKRLDLAANTSLALGAILLFGALTVSVGSFPWRSAQSDLFSLAALCVASFGIWIRFRSAAKLRVSALPLCGLLVLCASCGSDFFLSRLVFHGDLAIVLAALMACGLAINLGGWIQQRMHFHALIRVLCGVTLAAALLQYCIALVQVLAPDAGALHVARVAEQYALQGRAAGNMGQPNHLATLLVLGCVSALALRDQAERGKGLLLLAALVLASGISLSLSRIGLVSVTALALFGAFGARRFGISLRRSDFVWVGALAWICFVGYTWHLSGQADIAPKEMAGTGHRTQALTQFAHAIALKPWFGYGWLSTSFAQDLFVLQFPSQENLSYAHNLVVDLALWLGVPLALLVLFLLLAPVGLAMFKSATAITFWAFAMLLPFGLHCLVEYPFTYGYFLFPACIWLGVLHAQANLRAFSLPSLVLPIAAAVLLAFAAVGMQQYLRAEHDITLRRFERVGVGKAPSLAPDERYPLWDQLEALAKTINVRAQRGLSDDELRLEAAARFRYPFAGSILRYSALLAMNGRPAESRRQIEMLRHWFAPGWPELKEQICTASRTNVPELKAALLISPTIECPEP